MEAYRVKPSVSQVAIGYASMILRMQHLARRAGSGRPLRAQIERFQVPM